MSVWDKLAEIAVQAFHKGSPIVLIGRLESREYEKDGQTRTAYEITARDVVLPPRQTNREQMGLPAEVADDDVVPF